MQLPRKLTNNMPARRGNFKHGHARDDAETSEYHSWRRMRDRVLNPNSKYWMRYGGRGIKICERWMTSFSSFIEDMGNKPSPSHSLDRINNDGNYEPSNCRWATPIEQHNNTCSNRLVSYNGISMTIAQWGREFRINRYILNARLKLGWDFYTAATKPISRKQSGTGPAQNRPAILHIEPARSLTTPTSGGRL